MSENSGQERTEQATPKRLQKAREEGQLPRSRDLASAAVLLGGAVALMVLAPALVEHLATLMRTYLSAGNMRSLDSIELPAMLVGSLVSTLWQLAPFLGVALLLGVVGPLITGGWNFAVKSMAPKWERLDPIKGFTRILSVNAFFELLKTLLKFFVVGGVVMGILWSQDATFMMLGRNGVSQGLHDAADLVGRLLVTVCLPLLLLAAVDVPLQLWQHARRLRMTRQETKDEHKETEGRPEVKARVRQIQQQMAQQRMMHKVPAADVVVTNPTHFAVAMRYDRTGTGAPVVIAKGADLVALRIRALAIRNSVPVVEAPPLARALYHRAALDQSIPQSLYVIVAQVLAFVYQLDEASRRKAEPFRLDDLPDPEEPEES